MSNRNINDNDTALKDAWHGWDIFCLATKIGVGVVVFVLAMMALFLT